MRKKLLALAVLISSATANFAQTNNRLVATLLHEGTLIHYYGGGALTSAYKDAKDGDMITLSPGTFTSPGTINKGITLRGTGIDASEKSIVSGSITFCSTDSNRVTTIEGVRFAARIYPQNNASERGQGKIRFIKTHFEDGVTISKASTYSSVKGPEVRFYNVKIYGDFYYGANTYPDVFVYNSYVVNPYSASDFKETTSAFINCVVYYSSDNSWPYYTYNLNFYNCVFTFSDKRYALSAYATCRNCLSVGYDGFFNNQHYGGDNKTANTWDVWSEAEGHGWYELTDEAKRKFLGLDGTQVGLYGGNYPYNSKVQYPIITSFTSDVQSSKEGKLHINVEVDGE